MVFATCVSIVITSVTPAQAQFSLKRTLVKTAVCAGGAYGGYKLGEQLSEVAIRKMGAVGGEADKVRRSFQIGMAAALCGTGVLLTGTIYNSLSKRDREAREKEMAAALADANPGTRSYVLPDSRAMGRLETDAPEQDGDRQCRRQVDFLAKEDEPAAARWCRKSDKDKYELDI
jgi:hypothetical protein